MTYTELTIGTLIGYSSLMYALEGYNPQPENYVYTVTDSRDIAEIVRYAGSEPYYRADEVSSAVVVLSSCGTEYDFIALSGYLIPRVGAEYTVILNNL